MSRAVSILVRRQGRKLGGRQRQAKLFAMATVGLNSISSGM